MFEFGKKILSPVGMFGGGDFSRSSRLDVKNDRIAAYRLPDA